MRLTELLQAHRQGMEPVHSNPSGLFSLKIAGTHDCCDCNFYNIFGFVVVVFFSLFFCFPFSPLLESLWTLSDPSQRDRGSSLPGGNEEVVALARPGKCRVPTYPRYLMHRTVEEDSRPGEK